MGNSEPDSDIESTEITFPNGHRSRVVTPAGGATPAAVAALLGIEYPRKVILLFGGAARLDDSDLGRLRPLFEDALVQAAERVDAMVMDGGTDSGVMRLMGEARTAGGAGFPLLGVAPMGTVAVPGREPPVVGNPELEPNHTHFALVPGTEWGDELVWVDALAAELSAGERSVAVLVNGGALARQDIERSLAAGRPAVVIAGTGRLADELASDPDRHSRIITTDVAEGTGRILDLLVSILKGA